MKLSKLPQRLAIVSVKTALRLSFKLPSRLPVPLLRMRAAMDSSSVLFMPRKDVQIAAISLGGVPAEHLAPQQQKRGQRAILHIHGGAFFAGSCRTHRALASQLAARAQADVYVLDYRRAPEHIYPAALDDAESAYNALLAQGWRADQIVLGGDSGGCAHVLALVLRLRDQQQNMPAGLLMISPFVDLTLSLPSIAANAQRDPMLTAQALKRGADAYRGLITVKDARVSPLFAPLQQLPPMLIQCGSEEILLDDAKALAERAKAAGVDAQLQVYDGMWHNFQMFDAVILDAKVGLDALASFSRGCTSTGI